MFNRFARATREAVSSAVGEAARRGDRRVGTEHLLLGLLAAPTAPAVAALGDDIASARRTLDEMDREALALVGVDEPPVATSAAASPRRPGGRLPFTAGAKAALQRTLEEAVVRKDRTL